MSSVGDCFVILKPNTSEDCVILGRNSLQDDENEGVAQEVQYYNATEAIDADKDDGSNPEKVRIILQKPRPGVWGGDCGSNETISIGVSWSSSIAEEVKDGYYSVTDIVRYTLATAKLAADAVERIGLLVESHSNDESKFSLVICDASEAWIVNCNGKLWTAQCLSEGFHRIPSNGFAILSSIDKSSGNLDETLKSDDQGSLTENWCGDEPSGDGSFTLTSMFRTLRSAAMDKKTRSTTVFVLRKNGISTHWFTATPYANESVFKPFIFSPNPKISPLTIVPSNDEITLLHKLHTQRKSNAIEHLKELESSCVDEINRYLQEHSSADDELDELMKDCVEAEVKFYR